MQAVTDWLVARRQQVGSAALVEVGLSALAIIALGAVYCWLTSPIGYPSPLDPVAGVALALLLCRGSRGIAAVAIGALGLHLGLHLAGHPPHAEPLAAVGLAAATIGQAWIGARLIERHVARPLLLTEARDIALFFAFGGVVAAGIGATIAVLSLGIAQSIALPHWGETWLTWWTAQTLGVLFLAPVALTIVAEPRREWAARRAVISVTLLTLMLVFSIAAVQLKRLDDARVKLRFDREATNAAALLDLQLQRPLLALEAMHSVFMASESINFGQWRRAASSWVQAPSHIQALGWSEHTMLAGVEALEARARDEGLLDYRVRHRDDGIVPSAPADDVVAIRYIEPLAGNATALGTNAMSIPQARDAIERSIQSNRAAVTDGFRLSQDKDSARQSGVVVYRAIFDGAPGSAAGRRRAFKGVVFVTLRLDDLLAGAFASLPADLVVCLVDQRPGAEPRRLAGPSGCASERYRLAWDRQLPFADRNWTVRVGTSNAKPFEQGISDSWIVSSRGIFLSALIGALLLGMTGRARRIEAAVDERTTALREEARERERAEAAMRESEQRFRNIFNNVPIGVVYTDLEGRLQHLNPHFCKLSGFSADELLRSDLFDLLHPEDVEAERQSMKQLLDGEIAMHRGHCRITRKDGETVWVQSSLTLLRDAEGQPRRLVGVMEDISDHLRLIEAERAREQAEAANQAKNEFLSRMSHELRTPLNAMLGFAQLLELDERYPLAAGQRPWVTQIQHAGWHLLDMINDVLDLSRIESGNIRLQLENLDLEALVEASVALIEGDAAKRGIVIKRQFEPTSVAVVSDITRVKQILINLLSNAVKYNTDYGKIEIEIRHGESHAELVVRDSGLGMTAEQLEGLFQPFNRLGRERSGVEGTGIGLVISKRLAEWMGGDLRAESSSGAGSSFFLTLPLASAADTARLPLDPTADAPAYHRRIVHYIEDNETNIEVMRGILSRRPQVEMTVSMTGLDAVAELRRQPPDVILLDMNLPDIDGLDLLRHIKTDPATAAIPVIVVSADALGAQIDQAIAEGAMRYLTKPVSVGEVLRVVDEVLDVAVSRFV
ncbi:CHASE domain-containing protein [Piscinibacter sakaiensis]|uniref:CHASE domain-containing protein n=1 Tax=Piscinibacter sakaiensis TaxID=1547922 RepID=UPI003AAA8CBB